MKEPLVSVIIPTYNRPQVREAVKSVLDQTYENLEVIVVDDCSDTPAKEYLKDVEDERLSLFRHEENRNGSAARNTGISEASGFYIALLDDDDVWEPEKLRVQVQELKGRDKSYRVCYTGAKMVYSDHEEQIIPEKEGDITEELLKMEVNGSFGSTLLVEKEVVDEVGGFDEEFDMHQDWEFLLKVLEQCKICVVKEPLIEREVMYGYEPRDLDFLVKNKRRFLDKFEDKIDQTGFLNSREIRAKHYIKISQNAAFKGKIRPALKYFFIALLTYPFLGLRELGRPPYYYLRFLRKNFQHGK